jgi:ATP-dependent Clp protease protease subunit
MQYIKPDVATICTVWQHQWVQFYFVLARQEKRSALPHSRVMIHQPSGGAQGVATDMETLV